jgi:predicted XRE-type DNA-binding protein
MTTEHTQQHAPQQSPYTAADYRIQHITGDEDTTELTRTEKIRIAARVLIRKGVAGNGGRWGLQSRLAEHFGVTRQRVSQIVRQEMNAQHVDPR